ncbi:MAG: D-glycerate dehydrogenase [Candidatus Sumerlaeia bacterium]|nr:D-glycerate dehydrogenase [Candidatus Sumerlaeia bacterium]
MRVFVTRPIPEPGLAKLREAGHDVRVAPQDRKLDRAALLEGLAGAEAAITMLDDRIDAEAFDAGRGLRVVTNFAVGYNNIDVAAATARRIAVGNTPGVLTDATADLAWALLLAAARRLGEGEALVRAGQWEGWGPLQLLGWQVAGKTLGIVGAGRIGRAVARRGKGFDMRVLYYGRRDCPEIERETGARRVTLDELLAETDFLSLNCPLTPETHHLIGAPQLAAMKPTAILVNTARGPVVDEEALVEALKTGRIAAAGLDVYEKEPVVHPGLMDLKNVVLLPHVGSGTTETRAVMSVMCADNILAVFEKRQPPSVLNPEVL